MTTTKTRRTDHQATHRKSVEQQIALSAQHFESFSRRASVVVAQRAVYWQTITDLARRAGISPEQLAPALAKKNNSATTHARRWAAWLRELDAGRAELVPWQRGNEPIRFAVRRTGSPGPLGWWPVAVQVLRLAIGATLSGAGWLAADAWGESERADAEARKIQAENRSSLIELAKRDPKLAPQIIAAMEEADRAAADAGPDWIDRLTSAAGAGIGGSAITLIALYFILGQRRKNGRRRQR